MPEPMDIRRAFEVRDLPELEQGIDAIFFASSNTQSFADNGARVAFRERWLGRYLSHEPEWAYVALSADHRVIGYLVASTDDPALAPRFSDIPYFAAFKDLTRQFPAHLHVNIAPDARCGGIGTALVLRLISDAERAGVPGVHVVTSRGARNVGFYRRNGFVELGATGEGAGEVVFLARTL